MKTKQFPIGSGFGAASTTNDVLKGIDLAGKFAIVTGGYSGLGLAATRALSRAGARVVVGARRPDIAVTVLEGVTNVEIIKLDLADFKSIRSFASLFLASGRHAHMVINSAGIMACAETRIGDGWEAQFAVNHLGHFALIQHLWPALSGGDGCRVVSVSSGAHHITAIRWDDIHFRKGYNKWVAYGQSKTANVLFAVALDTLGQKYGVRAFSLHPGKILTPLQRHLAKEEMIDAGWINSRGDLIDPTFKSPEQGAATLIWAATSPPLDGMGGLYCEDCDIAVLSNEGDTSDKGVKAHAIDPEQAARLWKLSADMTGVNNINEN